MTAPTLDQALENITQFAGAPDPKAWSLDGEPFDLGLAVSVVRNHVADLRDELKAAEASLDGARAAAKTMADVANGLDLDVKRWRDQCPVTAEHVEAAGVVSAKAYAWQRAHRPVCLPASLATWMAVAMAINRWALIVCRPAHDILDEMAAIEVPT